MLSGKWLTTCCGVFRRILGIHLEMSHRAGCLCARELPAASEEGAPPLCSHMVHITTPRPARPRLHTQGAAMWSSVPDVCTALHLSHPQLQHNILWDEYQTLMINVCIQFQWSRGYSCPYTQHPCCRLFMVFLYSVLLHMDSRKKPVFCSLLLRHFSTLAFPGEARLPVLSGHHAMATMLALVSTLCAGFLHLTPAHGNFTLQD